MEPGLSLGPRSRGIWLSPGKGPLPPPMHTLSLQTKSESKGLSHFTVFHSTPDSEIEDLVNLGFWAFPGVVPISNPQASPGARNLEAEQVGAEAGPGPTPSSRRDAGRVPAGWGSGTPQELGTRLWNPTPALPRAAVTLDRSLGLPVRWKRHEPPGAFTNGAWHSECLVNATAALMVGARCPQTILLRSSCLQSQC